MSQDFCNICPARSTCQSICPELELFLKEDVEVPEGRELPVGLPKNGGKFPWSAALHLTDREREIVTLLGKGLSRDDVCKTLNIAKGNLRINLARLKKKHAEL